MAEHRNLCDGNDGMCRDDQDGKTYGDGTLVVQCAPAQANVYDYHIGNTVYGSCKSISPDNVMMQISIVHISLIS